MFESAELGHVIDKETFKKEVPKLRAALLDAQYDMLEKKEFPVVILISGVDGSGKGETINLLYSWMDPRHISTLAFSAPSDEERSRPYMWRYWRALPAQSATASSCTCACRRRRVPTVRPTCPTSRARLARSVPLSPPKRS